MLSIGGNGHGDEAALRLTAHYPPAYTDFHGSATPCIYKNGSLWPVRPEAQPYTREVRPVSLPNSVEQWRSLLLSIGAYLDSADIKFTFIDPLAYANAGEARPFCPLVIVIGVKPGTVTYQSAVDVVTHVAEMLSGTDFAQAEVAVVEGERVRHASSPMLLPFDPLLDNVPEERKPFTSTLGISISPRSYPNYGGTGSLYYQLGSGPEKRILLLTCAHVVCPPPKLPNNGTTITNNSQPHEEIISPGLEAFDTAIQTIKVEIGRQAVSIDVWQNAINRLAQNQSPAAADRREENQAHIKEAGRKITHLNKLLTSVQDRTHPDNRVIGFVRHCEPIAVSFGPRGFTKDWALIELNSGMIDWDTFLGNKIYVATRTCPAEYGEIMWPQAADSADYQYPPDGLLQAFGIVNENELRNPQHLDVHNQPCLLVVKNGATSGTTFGRVNGLESYVRYYHPYGIAESSMEFAVLNYDRDHCRFSEPGDSGSIVLDRNGKIVGVVTCGGGPDTDSTDRSYLTPYFDIHDQLVAKYPGLQLYPVVNPVN
ncbi:hypothetical protein MD484_g3330, partial [Candolleomyces efflorescens]